MSKTLTKAIGAVSIIVPISLTVAAAVAVASCAFYLISQVGYTQKSIAQKSKSTSLALAIHHVDPNAFGSLLTGSATPQANEKSIASAPTASPMMANAAGQTGAIMNTSNVAAGSVQSVTVTAGTSVAPAPAIRPGGPNDRIMPPIQNATIEYAYVGDPVALNDATLDVMKYTPSPISTNTINQTLAGLNLGIMNLASFPNANVTDFSVSQNTPFGYQISVSPQNGSVSIDQNWMQWQSANPNCQDDACVKASQLKPSDVPANDEIVKIADDFLAAHTIDRSSYGTGEVDSSWNAYPVPMMAAGAGTAQQDIAVRYVPDTMQVTYPLMVNGNPVYMNGGTKVGLTDA